MQSKLSLLALLALFLFSACANEEATTTGTPLPYLAPPEKMAERGVTEAEDFTIPDYRFVDQDSQYVTPATFDGSIYVADFFFTTCPTICPLMKTQMIRIYEEYEGDERVKFLSHSIDPVHDSVAVLQDFASRLGADSRQWHFVTGNKDSIYQIAESYMVSATTDPGAPGGYIHSGAFILVDEDRHIRGVYDGTTEAGSNKLMKDLEVLLREE